MFNNDARPNTRFTLWLMLHSKLLTIDRLIKWGLGLDPTYSLCHNHQESRNHLFVECEFARMIWAKILDWAKGDPFQGSNWESHLQWAIKATKGRSQTAQIFKMIYAVCQCNMDGKKQENL